MRLLVVTQYFRPENFRINEVTSSLVEMGHSVEVLTGKPNYPDGVVFPGYKAMGIAREFSEGVSVFRVPIFPRGATGGPVKKLRLILNYLSFIVSASLIGPFLLRKSKPDVILAYCPSPLLQAIPAIFIGWMRRIPVVVDVQDLWPHSLEATGYLRNKLIMWAVRVVVKFIYQHATLLTVSSRPFEQEILRLAPKARIVYQPNSADDSFAVPGRDLDVDVTGLDEKFSVVFAGNVGAAQSVYTILDAARLLENEPEIRIIIIGSGSELAGMQAQSRQLENIVFAGRFPYEMMPELLARASALLLTLADERIFGLTVPSKVQAYLAAGKPIVASINGEGSRIVTEAGAGLTVPAGNAQALAGAIRELYQMDPQCRNQMGVNGRAYYRAHFEPRRLTEALVGHLEDVCVVRA